MPKFTHSDASGRPQMVDVGEKTVTRRTARARGRIRMDASTLALLADRKIPKGDVFTVALLAGIQGAKETPRLIPLCHMIHLDKVDLMFSILDDERVEIISEVTTDARTGVEMEAMTAVSVAALTIYDMCKGLDRGITIEEICLLEKKGGKSGTYQRE